ncbi:MAG: replication-relaxation family protein [Tepidibacillus sp.]
MKATAELDLKILSDLYKYRTLSLQQLKKLYFTNSDHYVYRKLSILYKNGLVDRERIIDINTGRKNGSSYYITQKGIDLLNDHQLLEHNQPYSPRKAKNIRLQPYVLALNELYVQLDLWKWKDGREVKREFGFNNNAQVGGALIDPQGNTRFVYLIGRERKSKSINPDREKRYIEVQSKRIQMINNEIQVHNLKNVIILIRNPELYKVFYDLYSQTPYECWLFPYKTGINILKSYESPLSKLSNNKNQLFHEINGINVLDLYTADIQRLKNAQRQDQPFQIYTHPELVQAIRLLVGPNVTITSNHNDLL